MMRQLKAATLAVVGIALTGIWVSPVSASTPKLPAMLLSISQMPTGWAVYSGSSNGLGCLANVLEPARVNLFETVSSLI
jgi:hypothetical protein